MKPSRTWCRACVTGPCLSYKHIIVRDHEYDALHVVGFDKCCHGERRCHAAVDLVKTFVCRVSLTGHKRTVIRSDAGPSILACKKQVAVGLARLHGVEVDVKEIAVGDSQGNGLAKHWIRELRAKIKTLKRSSCCTRWSTGLAT